MSTPAQPVVDHDGRCGAQPSCKKGCDGFVLGRSLGGYRTCECTHTQQVHTPKEKSNA